eukprot:6824179-Prymnesium_polylepis.1
MDADAISCSDATTCSAFDAVLAQNEEHAQALAQGCGAKRTFMLGMQTHEVAGCAPRPAESIGEIYSFLPIVPQQGGSCPDSASRPLYVSVPGSVGWPTKPSTTAGNLTAVLSLWAKRWCDQRGHSVQILLEFDLPSKLSARQAPGVCVGKYLARYNPRAEEPESGHAFEALCDSLHCRDVALTIAYKGAAQSATICKPAERFLNSMSVGTPTIGDAHHVSTGIIVRSAAKAGLLDGTLAELLLPDSHSDLLAKVTTFWTNRDVWKRLQKNTTVLTKPFNHAATIAKYNLLRERAITWRQAKGGQSLWEP